MKFPNLSEWALAHRSFVLFLMIVTATAGVLSYGKLGQAEDPPFTLKVMVVHTEWPGASAHEVEQEVTERLEKKLQETPYLYLLQSYSKQGESQIFLQLNDSISAAEIANTWYQVRKKIGDIRETLPAGVIGPFFNDEFGDTFGNLYALTGDGYNYAQFKDYAEKIRRELLMVPDVAKVELIGEQDEKIYVEVSNAKLATLGIPPQVLIETLRQQNAMTAAGSFDTPSSHVVLRASGGFASSEAIADTVFRVGERRFRLGDIARVYRGYADPPAPLMRFMSKPALGIGVAMAKGGDIIELGRNLDTRIRSIQAELPVGLELATVSSQPRVVATSISEFLRALTEAVIIVLVVSFFSLGVRTGLVVALSIPLVLTATFFFMSVFNIGLHKVSLGALILSLGLLVDDAIIAVEMMMIKIEQGWERTKAASFAYTSTAFPMLTGTLVTVAGFLPIATAASAAGEYTRSIFQITSITLLTSWVVAVIFIPYLGFKLLPAAGRLGHEPLSEHAVYDKPFYRRFRRLVEWCVFHRKTTIIATVAMFMLSLFGFGFVQEQFFPYSTRNELIVDLRLAEGSSLHATEAQVRKLEALIVNDPAIENYVSYVGAGSPRFYLPLDQQLPQANFAQLVILTKDQEQREALRTRLTELFRKDFSEVRTVINRLENGPPVGFPIQLRVSGEDIPRVRAYAQEVANIIRRNPHLTNVHLNWDEPSKVIRVDIDQEKARLLGISSQDISSFLYVELNGAPATYLRERDKLVAVLLRGTEQERGQLDSLRNLALPTRAGKAVPLAQIATISYDFEPGIIWRRNRLPTITVRGNLNDDIQPATVTQQILPTLAQLKAKLPLGYAIEVGGTVEENAKGSTSIAAGVPLLVVTMLVVLMMNLQSMTRTALVVLTAPLGLIGVTLSLLVFNMPFGFVAMLGAIALSGMIMRNSVILVNQIEQDIAGGKSHWDAVIDSTVRRFRPIVLTALAAMLAMIPLTRSVFFGPMAVSIIGGLLVATVLTLLFLPALYATWYRVRRPA